MINLMEYEKEKKEPSVGMKKSDIGISCNSFSFIGVLIKWANIEDSNQTLLDLFICTY